MGIRFKQEINRSCYRAAVLKTWLRQLPTQTDPAFFIVFPLKCTVEFPTGDMTGGVATA